MEEKPRIEIDGLFSIRARNCILIMVPGIQYLDELSAISSEDLMNMRHFGKKCLSELREVLGRHKLALRDERPLTLADQRNFLLYIEKDFTKVTRKVLRVKRDLASLEKTLLEIQKKLEKRV